MEYIFYWSPSIDSVVSCVWDSHTRDKIKPRRMCAKRRATETETTKGKKYHSISIAKTPLFCKHTDSFSVRVCLKECGAQVANRARWTRRTFFPSPLQRAVCYSSVRNTIIFHVNWCLPLCRLLRDGCRFLIFLAFSVATCTKSCQKHLKPRFCCIWDHTFFELLDEFSHLSSASPHLFNSSLCRWTTRTLIMLPRASQKEAVFLASERLLLRFRQRLKTLTASRKRKVLTCRVGVPHLRCYHWKWRSFVWSLSSILWSAITRKCNTRHTAFEFVVFLASSSFDPIPSLIPNLKWRFTSRFVCSRLNSRRSKGNPTSAQQRHVCPLQISLVWQSKEMARSCL